MVQATIGVEGGGVTREVHAATSQAHAGRAREGKENKRDKGKSGGPIDHGHVVEGIEIQNLNLGRGKVGCSVGFRWGNDRENRYGPNGNYNRNKPNGGIKARLGPINGNSKDIGKRWVYKNRRPTIEKEARCESLDNIQGKRAISNVNPNPIPTYTKGIGKAQVGELEVSVPAKIKKRIGQLNEATLEAENGNGLMVNISIEQRRRQEGAGTSKGTSLGWGDQSPEDDAEVDDDERGANTDDDFGWEDDDSFLISSEDYTKSSTELGTVIPESRDVGSDGGQEDPLVKEGEPGCGSDYYAEGVSRGTLLGAGRTEARRGN
ncbi:hypothetical protein F0562_024979 [Nyssa sinensis]|uniref:Uncharacterized protein n=1 Tax=Nyssa sinensis TaxID=561372 RepID=A0A5J5BCU4_9ASTE|nr:hypothetical protein F0562_024979 [Nyssa sinensis]